MTEQQQRTITVGDRVRVRIDRGRRPSRTAVVTDVQHCESLSAGSILVGRWEDDGSTAWIVPGPEVELLERSSTAEPAVSGR